MAKYGPVLNRFINSDEFAEAVIDSTKAGFSGSNYVVELFPDETWRVIWGQQVDDSYQTTGMMLGIPQLNTDEFQDLKEQVGTDDTQKMAEVLREKDRLKEHAEKLRKLLRLGYGA